LWAKSTHKMAYKIAKKRLRKLLEKRNIRKIFGLNLAAAVLFTGVVSTPISAFNQNQSQETITLNVALVSLTTEKGVRVPLDNFTVTQGYSNFHRGIDLDGNLGDPVYPIMNGRVEGVFYSRFSYGNHLIINHGSGFKSLYAHLAKIVVKPGQEVDKNTVLGTVGSTGWSTGPHLHLEVYDNGSTFNPLTILK
jgi:murein DD-endopeptidase MepM/ murein hydrolase activator NlpD